MSDAIRKLIEWSCHQGLVPELTQLAGLASVELTKLEGEIEEAWDTAEEALAGWWAEAGREGQNPHGNFQELYDRVPEKKS